jgi:altronate dehydratase small subunit
MNLKQKVIILSPKDNVATALADLKTGDTLELEVDGHKKVIKLGADVPFGHKLSLSRIEPDLPVIKYGEIIGISTAPIEPGDYVHIHNIASARGRGDLEGGAK